MLSAHKSVSCFLQLNFTIEEWAENWQAHQEGKALRHKAVATVTSSDHSDSCATDTWELTATGWPVEQRDEGRWQLPPNWATRMQFQALPRRKRNYWISRQDNISLPQPSYDTGTRTGFLRMLTRRAKDRTATRRRP
jgi:hypothetical protein